MGQNIERPGALRIEGEAIARFTLLRGDTPLQHYPRRAKERGIDGFVTVDLLLNETGQVLEAQVLAESPLGEGFGLAALDTAKTYEFANPLNRLVLFALTIEFAP
ncbi:MAG: TonB family protein [Steroidobacteraceae bacterium]